MECGVLDGSRRVPENRGNFNRFRILGVPLAVVSHIVARVPLSFYRTMYKLGQLKAAAARACKRRESVCRAPFPPAVLRSTRWRCSCSCGRSCGSSVDDAFCGRRDRYAVMRIVTEFPSSNKYLGVYDIMVHHKYRGLFINNASRRQLAFARTEYCSR